MSRVGLFGGTFNPIHLGHLRAAEEAKELLPLDRVEFVLSSLPPHKPRGATLAPVNDRLRMLALALASNPGFKLNTSELERARRSYSIETIMAYRAAQPQDKLFFLLGADAFAEIQTWRKFELIFASCNLAVLSRPGFSVKGPPVAIEKEFCYDPASGKYVHRSGHSLAFVPITQLDISASAIRDRVATGGSLRYLVPPAVEEHIRQRGLYRRRLTN